MVDLDSIEHCPLRATCEACGTLLDLANLAVVTVNTVVGVYCLTLCAICAETGTMPRSTSAVTAVKRVIAHCEHLGIDGDQMAAALDRDSR